MGWIWSSGHRLLKQPSSMGAIQPPGLPRHIWRGPQMVFNNKLLYVYLFLLCPCSMEDPGTWQEFLRSHGQNKQTKALNMVWRTGTDVSLGLHTYLGASHIEISEACFWVDMHRVACQLHTPSFWFALGLLSWIWKKQQSVQTTVCWIFEGNRKLESELCCKL